VTSFRILLADDHPVFRLGLRSLLVSHEGWEVCGESADGRDAVEKCARLKPDLLILDMCMPELNGVGAARQIMEHNPRQRILVVTDVRSEQVIRECLEAGIGGWVFKSDGTQELISAVEALQRGGSSFSAGVSDLILDGYLGRRRLTADIPQQFRLSFREREVVQLVSEGKVSKEIAAKLGLSVKTVDTHRSNIMRKLSVHSIAELVLYAVRNEIIHVERPGPLGFPVLGNNLAVGAAASMD